MTLAAESESRLTARQVEILRVYAATGSMKITADRCGVATTTIRHTLANVRSRLGVDSTIQAAMIVFGTRG